MILVGQSVCGGGGGGGLYLHPQLGGCPNFPNPCRENDKLEHAWTFEGHQLGVISVTTDPREKVRQNYTVRPQAACHFHCNQNDPGLFHNNHFALWWGDPLL